MEEELLKRIEANSIKLDEVFKSVEKMRKYFLWTLVISVVVFVLPLIGLVFAIPTFLNMYSSVLSF